jgi:sulfate transport system substrate-binding protein
VDKIVDRRGTRDVALAYLKYLYSEEGQQIAAKHYFRPRLAAAEKYGPNFPQLKMFTVQNVFGGWQKAQATHFADGGVFDQIYQP